MSLDQQRLCEVDMELNKLTGGMLKPHKSRAAAGPLAHLLSPGLAVIALCESTSTSSLHQDTCTGHAQQHSSG